MLWLLTQVCIQPQASKMTWHFQKIGQRAQLPNAFPRMKQSLLRTRLSLRSLLDFECGRGCLRLASWSNARRSVRQIEVAGRYEQPEACLLTQPSRKQTVRFGPKRMPTSSTIEGHGSSVARDHEAIGGADSAALLIWSTRSAGGRSSQERYRLSPHSETPRYFLRCWAL